MVGYVIRRLLSGVLLVFSLTLVTFILFAAIPLDPAVGVLGVDPSHPTTAAERQAADHRIGVDRPVEVQYAKFVWRLVRHGSFGRTFHQQRLNAELRMRLPVTGSILLGGALLLVLLSLALGTLSALRAQTILDRTVLVVSLFGIALHPFVVGILLRKLFSEHYHLVAGRGYCGLVHPSPPLTIHFFPSGSYQVGGGCHGVASWASHLALPWLTFAAFFLPLYTRMVRGRLLETLDEQYVVTARAKGASAWRVLRRHVLRNALTPLITMVGLDLGGALLVSIYVETVFALNGMGQLALGALNGEVGGYDLPTMVAITFVVASTILVLNLVVDLGYAVVDPRIRIRSRELQ